MRLETTTENTKREPLEPRALFDEIAGVVDVGAKRTMLERKVGESLTQSREETTRTPRQADEARELIGVQA